MGLGAGVGDGEGVLERRLRRGHCGVEGEEAVER